MLWHSGLGGHGGGVPITDALLEVAYVGQQCWAGGAESESGIFHYRLAAAHGREEVAMMISVVAVSLRQMIAILHFRTK